MFLNSIVDHVAMGKNDLLMKMITSLVYDHDQANRFERLSIKHQTKKEKEKKISISNKKNLVVLLSDEQYE